MKTTLTMVLAALATVACSAPDEYLGPQNRSPAMTITSIETTTGADAISDALRDVAAELSSPEKLALTAEWLGQSVEERRAVLVESIRDLESQLQGHVDSNVASAACSGNSNASFATRITFVWLGRGKYNARSLTVADRRTVIAQSTLMSMKQLSGFDFANVSVDRMACATALYTSIRGRYDIAPVVRRTYTALAETSHLLSLTNLGMYWTASVAEYRGSELFPEGTEY